MRDNQGFGVLSLLEIAFFFLQGWSLGQDPSELLKKLERLDALKGDNSSQTLILANECSKR